MICFPERLVMTWRFITYSTSVLGYITYPNRWEVGNKKNGLGNFLFSFPFAYVLFCTFLLIYTEYAQRVFILVFLLFLSQRKYLLLFQIQ